MAGVRRGLQIGWLVTTLGVLASCPILCQSGWAHEAVAGHGHSATKCMNADDCVCQGALLERVVAFPVEVPEMDLLAIWYGLAIEVRDLGQVVWRSGLDPPWARGCESRGRLRARLGRYLI